MKQSITQLAKELGKRGGLATKKRGRNYYKQIGKLGLVKRYKKPLPLEEPTAAPASK